MAQKKRTCHEVPVETMALAAMQRLDFHGAKISTGRDEQTGKVYCVPKEMSEQLGLSWASQLAKLKGDLYKPFLRYVDINTPSGVQTTTLLDVDLLPTWLLSIQVQRVKAERRETLLAFQRECAQALRDYWTQGVATRSSALDHFPEMRATVQAIEAAAEARLLAEQATKAAHEATVLALQASIDATMARDIALEEAKRMTIEQFVLKNGLLRQFPVSQWRSMASWLTHYCQQHGLSIYKEPVPGRLWSDENSYPITALGGYLSYENKRSRQMPLVEEESVAYATVTP